MGNLSDIKQFKLKKLAGVFESDLKNTIKEIENTYRILFEYRKYKPIKRILIVLKEEREILMRHLATSKKIIETHGKISE